MFCLILVGDACSTEHGKIQQIEIRQTEGVGPNGFLFVLIVADSNLLYVLEKCECRFEFSPPLEELNTSSIRCFKVSDREIHVTVISTLWAALKKEEIVKKQKKLNTDHVVLEIFHGPSVWKLSN